ncbi:DUF2779 domain-containing protein [Christiangramia forsetii]|uniref:DUF2779 domain-containing protein n=2 Tax=Christiangramia forsetii TaxID=411153 RepID=A0M1R4_CHRFK|nr:DUF2779 domain-containing protein [Christiangramia forsetii]GGG41876.1 hypothetical protein GCM10011532_27080 [Christiangramia forsetii]CAL66559.1 conserved hypothetical protein [Christiangramia forsetii KT0803]
MRVLSKSRFKLGLECPNKLFYTNNKEYANTKNEDSFLEALAQGGFQVEELARMHYPNGILIEGNDWDYQLLSNQTKELLKEENVIIYEAAFLVDGLFIRTDILVKKGNNIELIEVKSKSFTPDDDYIFIGKSRKMLAGWKPYLFDVAFQKYVMQLCYPDWDIKSFIMMADKSKKASIDSLNQLFRISNKEDNRTGIIKKVNSLNETGNSVLGRKNITDIIAEIELNKHLYHSNLDFKKSINLFKELYKNNEYANWPTTFSACKKCEFKSSNKTNQDLKSGFRECFSKQHNWKEKEFNEPNTFDIYDFRKGTKLFDEGVFFKKDLTEDSIGLKEEAEKLTTSHRQWLQIEKEVNNDDTIYADIEGLKKEIDNWNYPLHFIDFETSTVALPFNKNLRPYEQTAFQFSHHIYYEDGTIEHANEYINNIAGVFPNFEFIRALQNALGNDNGTIFRYSHHENTILNAIYVQLLDSNEKDKDDLITFIENISHSKRDSTIKWQGERDMVDLWEIEKRYYYNPITKGSNSIKAVLPASLNSSKYLKEKYSKPINEIKITSKNFSKEHIWLEIENDIVKNPYEMLPPVFQDWSEDEIEKTLSEIEGIADGGAALTAYGKLQYTDMEQAEVDKITSALLKYCELDTLAMVMIFEQTLSRKVCKV